MSGYYYECPACRECIGIEPDSISFATRSETPERVCAECFEPGCVACILDDLCIVCEAERSKT